MLFFSFFFFLQTLSHLGCFLKPLDKSGCSPDDGMSETASYLFDSLWALCLHAANAIKEGIWMSYLKSAHYFERNCYNVKKENRH